MDSYQKIIQLLQDQAVDYELLEHQPVYTSQQAATVRGLKLEQGAKSLLFKADRKFILVVLGGDKKVDWKKLKKTLFRSKKSKPQNPIADSSARVLQRDRQVKKIRMATPEEVFEVMGVEIGACYPFGNIAGLKTYVDKSLLKQKKLSCNPGRHDVSIIFKTEDYLELVKPEAVDVI